MNKLGRRIAGIGAVILAFLLAIPGITPASAADGNNGKSARARVARDLRELFEKGSKSGKVRVVATLKKDVRPEDVQEAVAALGGEVRMGLHNVGQVVLEVPSDTASGLVDVPGLDYLVPDRPVQGVVSHVQTTTGSNLAGQVSLGGLLSPSLTPLDGRGIGVAVIDSGIQEDHMDLRSGGRKRTILSVDFVKSGNSDDPYGHGSHVAGIIAGNGWSSLQVGMDYTGIAPGASLVNLRVLDGNGRGLLSNVIAAIDFSIAYRQEFNIRVINLSLAAPPIDSYRDDPLCLAVERATKAGLVVAVAAGNFGLDQYGNKVYGGIASPGISPAAITVGAVDTRGTNARSDDVVAPYSSHGPTRSHRTDPVTGEVVYDDLAKPDLVAPGYRVVSLERYDNLIVRSFPSLHVNIQNDRTMGRYMILSGTSMSTAVVSGAAALILQANPSLTPNMVKAILMYSAQMLNGADLFEQGSGLVNIEGAVRLARALRKDAGTLLPGTVLASLGLPQPTSTIAGETVVWGQALIWGKGLMMGAAALTMQQEAYAQALIWGNASRLDVFGAGVDYREGLFSDTHVVFAQNNQWRDVTWDAGEVLTSGLIWHRSLFAAGVVWQNQLISEDFYTLAPTALIWGNTRYGYDVALIWGSERYVWDVALIWSLAGGGY